MKYIYQWLGFLTLAFLVTGCGGGSSGGSGSSENNGNVDITQNGTISIGITDGPSAEIRELTVHLTHLEMGDDTGQVTRYTPADGPREMELTALQNGTTEYFVENLEMPGGRYQWMEFGIEMAQTHLEFEDGRHHDLRMASGSVVRVEEAFTIEPGDHHDYVLDFDIRRSIHHHDGRGMMEDQYELHPAMRLVRADQTGSLVGTVDMSLIDAYHEDCDPSEGGNWAYLYHGDTLEPDDLESGGNPGSTGPIGMDRVEMDSASGEYRFHFAYVPSGTYRVAFSCSSEWDALDDDDYPDDAEGRFGFQAFTSPLDVQVGHETIHHIGP
jgi:uncharacterized protein DUF4382